MRMRRDAEAVAAYRDILREQGKSPDGMSDEEVIECVEHTVDAILKAGRAMAKAIQGMIPALTLAARALTVAYPHAGLQPPGGEARTVTTPFDDPIVAACVAHGGHFWPSDAPEDEPATCTRCWYNPGWVKGATENECPPTPIRDEPQG